MLNDSGKATPEPPQQEAAVCSSWAGLAAVGMWALEPGLRWADRRAFLGESDRVEPSGPGFVPRQLEKEDQLLFLS